MREGDGLGLVNRIVAPPADLGTAPVPELADGTALEAVGHFVAVGVQSPAGAIMAKTPSLLSIVQLVNKPNDKLECHNGKCYIPENANND